MDYMEFRKSLLKIVKKVYKKGLVSGTSGNLSLRVDESKILITPKAKRYEKIRLDDFVLMSIDGQVLEGTKAPSSEWQLHREIYRSREDVNSVIHTHSICGCILAALDMPLPVILDEQREFLGGDIKVAKYASPGSLELAKNVIEALKGRKACILSKHGIVAVGKSLDEAYDVCELFERLSKIYIFMHLIEKK